ncbi:hypothetical protein CFP66_26350 [Pseudonocardia sp. MH-G8]|nr:hypothetical protein CFP66_26350 [Pseudonocardia sp. MH-G8]
MSGSMADPGADAAGNFADFVLTIGGAHPGDRHPRGARGVAAFGSMHFAITSMTDADHRKQFFAPVIDDVERILAVRAVYLAVRDTSRTSAPTTPSG